MTHSNFQPNPQPPYQQQPITIVQKSSAGKVVIWILLTLFVFIPLLALLGFVVVLQLT